MSAVQQSATTSQSEPGWYTLSPADALAKLSAQQDVGLSSAEAKSRLDSHGRNVLPAEKVPSGFMRFLGEYRNYMQIILLAAAVASILIGQMPTGVLLILLTLVNATTGMIEEGRAASAMNALQSMTVQKVKVRRDGQLVDIDPGDLVPGDIVPLAAGDRVPADGRIVVSNAMQIDESALTGESTPAVKQVDALSGTVALGDQLNMAFENTNLTHGDGLLLITGTGADTQVGQVATMLKATTQDQPPLARQLNRLTIWIALAAGVTMLVMFVVGFIRQESHGGGPRYRGSARGASHGRDGHLVSRLGRAGQAQGRRKELGVRRDPWRGLGDQLRQDRHVDHEPDDGHDDHGRRP
jgi:Ca2+-transporting ATPase